MNDNHRRVLTATFVQLDQLTREIERAASSRHSPFSGIAPDLQPVQQQVVSDYLERLRERLLEAYQGLGLQLSRPRVSASWAIQTSLTFAEITIEETSPSRLRGYGVLSEEDQRLIQRIQGDLDRIVRRLHAYVLEGLGRDLGTRLKDLGRVPVDLGRVALLERVIREQGLVEFRGSLEALIERLEAKTFDIAVFGRVSSGKSSLLNAVLRADVLPVGVTPVTSVPTRIVWGEVPRAEIHLAERDPLEVGLEQLGDYVSEQRNPDNVKRVVRVVAHVPSDNLRGDLALVDTPGLGSLARAGARASYAYLPRCDLGVLLVDAANAPGREDLDIVRLLYESGIPVKVALSKVDLLSASDRVRARDYLVGQLRSQLGVDVSVGLVSTVGVERQLSGEWFDREIAPLVPQAGELARSSASRKLAALDQSVVATLRARLAVRGGGMNPGGGDARRRAEQLALDAEQLLHEAERKCGALLQAVEGATPHVLQRAVAELTRILKDSAEQVSSGDVVSDALVSVAAEASDHVRTWLLETRDQLNQLLQQMSAVVPGFPVRLEELHVDFLGQPHIVVPTELASLELDPPRWIRRLHGLLEGRVRQALTEAAAPAVTDALVKLGSRLLPWSRAVLKRLAEQFGGQAEPLRAHARALDGGAEAGDGAALRAALDALGGGQAAGSPRGGTH
ncbi:MAG TPA: dynamin family protein [Anaeromyxobacteraceae bacterium]|nr:dynamin family protein [Anaeromyxobacteraceae bacterium]